MAFINNIIKYHVFIVKKFVKHGVTEWCSGCRRVVSFDPDHFLNKIKNIKGRIPQFYIAIENDVVNYHSENQEN